MCGERKWGEVKTRPPAGSSPRVRGTRSRYFTGRRTPRFIPACAGNADLACLSGGSRSDHPRVCGEREASPPPPPRPFGSSPRVRGTPPRGTGTVRPARFIPACAGNASSSAGWRIKVAVHPRVCGERADVPAVPGSSGGSSPRVRGTLPTGNDREPVFRFIPACAGNATTWRSSPARHPVHPRVCGERTSRPASGLQSTGSSPRVRGTRCTRRRRTIPAAVHPRVCGERCTLPPHVSDIAGSSPRVRGTPRRWRDTGQSIRFIPACAGNAQWIRCVRGAASVHPRVCGERFRLPSVFCAGRGSSPRVRGTPVPDHSGARTARFIPACAGNAGGSQPDGVQLPVHPRVCGERCRTAKSHTVRVGSSPRVRGTRNDLEKDHGLRRFIPACAGNAMSVSELEAAAAVHPRVCGERFRFVAPPFLWRGSSPRVRGTPDGAAKTRVSARFIPACAGNAPAQFSPKEAAPVHPRVCGERSVPDHSGARTGGSSPRVRGTHRLTICKYRVTRFIPACAGNALRDALNWPGGSVHPRVCGERAFVISGRFPARGSSPRVRGTLDSDSPDFDSYRFIPACAGNACRGVR